VAEPPISFVALLRQLCIGAGLTQEELAEAASVSEAATALRQALTTYQRIGSPAAVRVEEILRDHGF
jgi:transcriptional regulator with XRE-family HTH domain